MIADCPARLRQTLGEMTGEITPEEAVLVIVLAGLLLAALSAPWLLRAYGRTMSRYMGFRQVAEPPPAWWQRRARLLDRPSEAAGAPPVVDDGMLAQAMQQRERAVRFATIGAVGVFMLGGMVVFALLFKESSVLAWGNAIFLLGALIAGPALVNVKPEGATKPLLIGTAIALIVTAALEMAADSSDWDSLLIGVVVMFAGLALCLHRRLRTLFVPLAVLGCAAAAGLAAAILALVPAACMSEGEQLVGLDWALGIAAIGGMGLAFGLCVWLGVQLLAGLAWLYERGVVSDLSLVAGSGLLLVTALGAFGGDVPVATSTMVLAWCAWWASTMAAYIAVLRTRPRPTAARSLLVLRVFARDHKSERLLDAVQTRWRCAGPVLQIGGPDLAKLNIDPYELVKFVSFRTHDLFLPGEATHAQLLDCLDLASDREGRFRVNEVFCFDTAWRPTVEKLMDLADAILLDLRGFRAERAGTAYEITRLAVKGRLGRVVAIGDAVTDWACVERLFGEAAGGAVRETRMDAQAPGVLEACVAALVEVAVRERFDAAISRAQTQPGT